MKNVLLVDDESLVLLALSKSLSVFTRDCRVLTARNGKEAVKVLNTHPIDLMVTDLGMPVMDGYELVAYARENYPYIPTYVMTGDYLPEVERRLVPVGVYEYISKPFSFKELAVKIARELEEYADDAPRTPAQKPLSGNLMQA